MQQRSKLARPLQVERAPRFEAPARLFRIQVQPLDAEPGGRVIFLPPDQVAYLFRASAVRHNLIQPDGAPLPDLGEDCVYVRTVKGMVYRSARRSLSESEEELGHQFFFTHQSILVNQTAVVEFYTRPDYERVGARVASGIDYLAISRRRLAEVKRRLLGRGASL